MSVDLSNLSWQELDALRDEVERERWRRYGESEAVQEVPTEQLLYILDRSREHCPNAPELDSIRQELRRREGSDLPGRPVLSVTDGGGAA